MEIDVENVNVDFDWLESTLTQNGHYEIIEDEETGEYKPELIGDWQEGDEYDFLIQVPQTINPLETLTNKRLQSEQTYTISSLMQDSTNNAGITKNSTLIVDLPDYPPTTSQKILNLTQNTTNPQTIYPNPGEYWDSIQYNVNVVIPKPTIYYWRGSDNSNTNFTNWNLISDLTYTTTYNWYSGDCSFFFALNGSGKIRLTRETASGSGSPGYYILKGNISLGGNITNESKLHLYDSEKNELFSILLNVMSGGNNSEINDLNKYFNLSYKNDEWLGN